MDKNRENTPGNNEESAPSEQLAQNPNPRANENIRVRSEEDRASETGSAEEEVGSEITDGEDA